MHKCAFLWWCGCLFMAPLIARCCRVSEAVNLFGPGCRGADKLYPAGHLFANAARLLVLLAMVEWTQAGRCFLTLMSLPNETCDRNGRGFMAHRRTTSRAQHPGFLCLNCCFTRHLVLCAGESAQRKSGVCIKIVTLQPWKRVANEIEFF